MSIYKQEPTDLDGIETYDLLERHSKVGTDAFGKPIGTRAGLREFFDSLPAILAGNSLKVLARDIIQARVRKKPVIWGIGGHVIKTGLAPLLNDLAERGYLTALACNGSVVVHDAEIALAGNTSEDVEASLGEGGFGAARQTGELINRSASKAIKEGIGLGESVGRELVSLDPEHAEHSLLCFLYQKAIPVTAHLTIGADIGHFHPGTDGAALGAASHTDFRLFCSIVREMDDGGVYLNIGSAVVLPEIFLKAVTVNRNLGNPLNGIITANFDFIQHYRPQTNVVRRPTASGGGRGYSITGHHELMIPLLAAAITAFES